MVVVVAEGNCKISMEKSSFSFKLKQKKNFSIFYNFFGRGGMKTTWDIGLFSENSIRERDLQGMI